MPFTEGERQFLRQYQRLYYIWVLLGDKVYLEVEMRCVAQEEAIWREEKDLRFTRWEAELLRH